MRNRTYGGVRGRKTKVGRKLSFSSYSIRNPILSHPVAFRKILNYPNLIQKMAKNGKKSQKIAF